MPLMRTVLATLALGITLTSPAGAFDEKSLAPRHSLQVDQVWSAHPVNFALVSGREHCFIAYYDAQRRMTVASLPHGGSQFTRQPLDSVTGWDSHNYLAMAEDEDGHLHVIGNMHNDPLVYFRTTRPGDVQSLQRVAVLVDPARERRMTYPVFLQPRGQALVLKYRDGGSGNGNEIYVSYDTGTRRWRSLLDAPLVDGEGRRNAYFVGPIAGPDGWFHLTWVWRDTPDAETNHDLSYARSRDLVHWQRSDGTPLELPITLDTAEIVDAVPVRGGMINNNTVVGFDSVSRPVITYHKFDANGGTQMFLARREARGWRVAQLTRWQDFRWDFRGRGSLDSRVRITRGAAPASRRHFALQVQRDGETLDLLVDSRNLRLSSESRGETLADRIKPYYDAPPGMFLNALEAIGRGGDRLVLAWATLPPNRDQPRSEIPAPTTLRLMEFARAR